MDWSNSEEVGQMLKAAGDQIVQDNHERMMAIVSGVELEEMLGESIVRVGERTSRNISRVSFSDRIMIAKRLGLLSRFEANDLDVIRLIRNVFAHEKYVNFSSAKVIRECAKLKIPTLRPDLFDDLTPVDKFRGVVLVLGETVSRRAGDQSRRLGVIPAEMDSRIWEEYWS